MEYLAFALWCFAVALAGGLVGLVLGNLRLPAAVALADSPAAGAGANLVISAVSATAASSAHVRAGRINWRLFWWMAPPSAVGALAGGYLSGAIPGDLLLAFIAAVLLVSGLQLLRWQPGGRTPDPGDGSTPAEPPLNAAAAVLTGAAIGVLGGLVGLILGSLRMPALLRFVGERPHRAVGTNSAVGVVVGVAGAIGHLPTATPDWRLAAVGAAASIPGALLGSRLTGRLSEVALVRAVAVVLLVVAVAIVAQAVG